MPRHGYEKGLISCRRGESWRPPARRIWLAPLALHSSWSLGSCLLGTARWSGRTPAGRVGQWGSGGCWKPLAVRGDGLSLDPRRAPAAPLPAHSWKCCLGQKRMSPGEPRATPCSSTAMPSLEVSGGNAAAAARSGVPPRWPHSLATEQRGKPCISHLPVSFAWE